MIGSTEAEIELRTSHANLDVWGISDRGEAVTPLPTTGDNGVLRFDFGPQPPWNPSTAYYLIIM